MEITSSSDLRTAPTAHRCLACASAFTTGGYLCTLCESRRLYTMWYAEFFWDEA